MAGFHFGRKRSEGYPGKGFFRKPKPLRRAVVNREICKGCGDCSEACYYRRIRINARGKAYVKRGCAGCAACMNACSSHAITMTNTD
ncbi:MAG: hypothetical protein ABFR50_08360 [Candidatus Fermentibacteria bacterium]